MVKSSSITKILRFFETKMLVQTPCQAYPMVYFRLLQFLHSPLSGVNRELFK